MRVAIFNDIHGNTHALDAVLDAVSEVDEYWVLGDLAAIGGDPAGAIERVRALPNARVIRGNTDRYLYTLDRPPPPQNPNDLDEMMRGFLWSVAAVEEAGHLDWLRGLPLEDRVVLPDGTRVLLVHASPGADDGPGFSPNKPDDATAMSMLDGCAADIVCVAHTHQVVDRSFGDVRVCNAGAVSNQPPGLDKRAAYAILECDDAGYAMHQLRVDFDSAAAIALLDASDFPAAQYVRGLLSD